MNLEKLVLSSARAQEQLQKTFQDIYKHKPLEDLDEKLTKLADARAERERELSEASGRYLANQLEPRLARIEEQLSKAPSVMKSFWLNFAACTLSALVVTLLLWVLQKLFG